MCGIAGFLEARILPPEEAREDLRRMAAVLAHRGPDDEGIWLDAAAGVGLAHRRLSILDLSPLGHQPMLSSSGRSVVSFNGEVYNHAELRAELARRGHTFRGGSDTEVLLAACEEWGVRGALERCRGMFAFALWSAPERMLYLARDRFGEKPLYYALEDGRLIFGSELKALREHPAFRAEVSRDALALYMRRGYIPSPHSIYRSVRKVRPGCLIAVATDGHALAIRELEYWQPSAVATLPRARAGEGADAGSEGVERGLDEVLRALKEAVGLQMVADVPVGAFLSGGIDSSLVVSLMQRAGSRPVKTFSIGFAEREFDEAPFARAIARHLGTDHTELTVTPRDALAVIPRLAEVYDEPFADASQIPTMLLCRLARRHVTVSLSGDGGDELFGGYGRYFDVRRRWSRMRRVPRQLRRGAARLIDLAPLSALDLAARPAGLLGVRNGRALPDQLQRRAAQWCARTLPEYYHLVGSFWAAPGELVRGAREPHDAASRPEDWPPQASDIAHMMYVDTRLYMPDDVLVKVDRAAMAVALETRVPLLDPRVAEAAWRIPLDVHLQDGRGKWVLRQLLERHVPRALFERPKMGFGVPIGRWLKGELREWAGDLIAPARLKREGYFEPALIERCWRQHQQGAADWSTRLWIVLMFQSWLEESSRPRRAEAQAESRRYDLRAAR
ncbi:MAG: asparagine synthase (glutamine-hydrolyzing) [Steroidobacteraceae bacterium]